MRGSDVVVWSAGAGGGSPERTYAVDRDAAIRSMDAAAQAGVGRYVMVSYFGAGPDHGVPEDNAFHAYAEAKAAADEHLQGTDLAWTILRPSALTTGAATGHIATGEGVVAGEVSRDNVAHVIRSVVEHPDSTARRILAFNDGFQPIDEVVAPDRLSRSLDLGAGDVLGDDEVLPRHADALEDVGPVRRPLDPAEHDVLERVHVGPVEGALGGREDDVARLAMRRPDLLDDDERAPEQARPELAPVRLVRPDGHDARAVGDPVVAEHRESRPTSRSRRPAPRGPPPRPAGRRP